ncbi:unnamed protein product [Gongylonema pulchrum]|uniref:C-type lectin domain-containing protein n=1 Tax=Gongylonema pulchrum TaxID=637853 RepID=A0A183EMQ1_9BILA|nr:unnamed protein product [Gongylonema pulchrum]
MELFYQKKVCMIQETTIMNLLNNVLLQPTVSGETKYWIGLHRRNVHGQYEWSDGSAFDYMVQTVVNEDPDEEAGACTAIKFNVSKLLHKQIIAAYTWIHQRCDSRHLAICRKPGFDFKVSKTKSRKEEEAAKSLSWKCSREYKLFRGMCYKVFGTKNSGVSFSEAINGCKNEKANLVSLTDIYEHGFFHLFLPFEKKNFFFKITQMTLAVSVGTPMWCY